MLKTGVKEGPNKGKSFYVCVDKQGCDFSQLARYFHRFLSDSLFLSLSVVYRECVKGGGGFSILLKDTLTCSPGESNQ